MVNLCNDWDNILKDDFNSDWYLALREFLKQEYSSQEVFPDMYDIFAALKFTSFADTKVVILGQDPYHNPKEAHGLCFSVQHGIKTPPSLTNVFKELQSDLGTYIPNNGNLTSWAKQGVLLLNTILTVRRSMPMSHKGKGWERLTDHIIQELNDREQPVVFILWGSPARKKKALITNPHHLVLESPHPSPLSAYYGFYGNHHFSLTNEFLKEHGMTPIDFQIKNI